MPGAASLGPITMPVAQKHHHAVVPKVYHNSLETTFCGINHPLSTPETPIHQYLGIKYASIPARFRPSKLFKSYPIVCDATRHGPICPQPKCVKSFEEALCGLSEDDIPRQDLKHNEFECLNLNITCPGNLPPESRVPVMLWVHGGGERGSGSSWIYDAGPLVRKSLLMDKPVIIVTFNFRIGLFGFAASPMIREDNRHAGEEGVGNYGLRDQRKVMEWLHHYIAGFGGDPTNITVFGESSGGGDIICHLLSIDNQVRPMFQRAIVQSAIFDYNMPEVHNAGWHLSKILSVLGVSTMEQLRAVDASKLANLGGYSTRTVDDGEFLRPNWKEYFVKDDAHMRHHLQIHDHMARARSRSSMRNSRSQSRTPASASTSSVSSSSLALPANMQPLIIGDCACDSTLWYFPVSLWTPSGIVRRIKAVCQSLSKASNVLRAYDITAYTPDDEIVDRVLELVNDARVAWPTECIAQGAKRERGGRGVWRYVFDQESPSRGTPHHAADLIYLFDTVPLPEVTQGTSCTDNEVYFDGPYDVSDDEEEIKYPSVVRDDSDESDGDIAVDDADWGVAVVDEWTYARVRDAIQERWITFAHGEAPWREDKVFVFGPEGETGERSTCIFEGRRRKELWKEALEPLGMHLAQKVGLELSRGPSLGAAEKIRC